LLAAAGTMLWMVLLCKERLCRALGAVQQRDVLQPVCAAPWVLYSSVTCCSLCVQRPGCCTAA
jgi:hypothetical protein